MNRRKFFRGLGGLVAGVYLAVGTPALKIRRPRRTIAAFTEYITPILRNVMPNLNVADLAHVQPMSGPPAKLVFKD